jgi:hypothetical protein
MPECLSVASKSPAGSLENGSRGVEELCRSLSTMLAYNLEHSSEETKNTSDAGAGERGDLAGTGGRDGAGRLGGSSGGGNRGGGRVAGLAAGVRSGGGVRG